MSARLADSALYAHLWGTAGVRAVFDERGRLQGWLDVLAALARAQAALGPRARPRPPSASSAAARRRPRPRAGGRARPARTGALDARADPRAAAGAPAGGHASTSTSARPSRTSPTPGPRWPCGRSGGGRGATCAALEGLLLDLAVRHRDTLHGRADPRPAGRADHLRLEGRLLGRRDRAATSTGSTRARRAGSSASSAAAVGTLAASATGRPALCGPGSAPSSAWPTRASRGYRAATGSPSSARVLAMVDRHAGPDRQRGLRAAAARDRRAARARAGGRRRQHHDAAQAQPRAQRAPGHPRPAGPRLGRRAAGGHGRRARARRARPGRPSGSRCPRSAC